jgi:type II secretory pathway pseudopilin PulG
MTLVELLVVLTILALLTTVAVTSTDVFLNQGRHEATTRTLTNIEDAVLGPANARQADGAVLTSGFVADLGRLPLAASSDPLTGLAELWSNPGGVQPFAIRPAPSDPEVLVPSGWRGPYLRLPVGQGVLRDGWGNPVSLLNGSGNPAATGEAIAAVRSFGADGAPGGTQDYDVDLTVTLADRIAVAASGNVYVLDGNGQRQNPPDPSQIRVVLYGPNPTTGNVLETVVPTTVRADGVVSYAVATTPGPRFLRAYLGAPATRKSLVVRFERSDLIHLDIR